MWLLREWTTVAGPSLEEFGFRLAALRRSRGLTQEELGDMAGSSQRMIAHYGNTPDAQPPAGLVAALARALRVTTDQLLGIEPLKEDVSPKTARLLKRLRRVEELPPADQRAILKFLDALLDARKAS